MRFVSQLCIAGLAVGGLMTAAIAADTGALQQPRDNLTASEMEAFQRGRTVFHAQWEPRGTAPVPFSGLGPVFNTNSCASCHVDNGRGPPPRADHRDNVAVVVKFAADDKGAGESTLKRYGNRLNYRAVPGVPVEGALAVSFETIAGRFADGESYLLHKPRYSFAALSNGTIEKGTRIAVRMAPPIAGLGLLEKVPEDWIRARAAANAANKGPVKGKPNQVWDPIAFRMTLGRFGWRADQPNLTRIIAAAFITDMGLTSRLFPQENCGELQAACNAAAPPHPAEVDDPTLDAITQYVSLLKPPPSRLDAEGERGRAIFESTGCSACHVPKVPVVISGVTEIAPYTDLLLHDMGAGLADGMPEAAASGREWRTAPLWGLGEARRMSERTGYLHDGRAFNIAEAILWHGGEAGNARANFIKLDALSRAALLKFLDQL